MLAAAHETGLLSALEAALPQQGQAASPRLVKSRPTTRRKSLLTLLFLGAVGLRRPWDLRAYTGEALALLSGRGRAYGYWHIERFLAQVAQAGSDQPLTDALAAWTSRLWQLQGHVPAAPFYVDGHRKAVYADHLIPRGLVARYGKVLGCRALVLLHDAAGHPLLATTHRGDLHLTIGVPSIVARFEAATQTPRLVRLIIDREGMSADFLATLAAEGRTVVTVLRTDQYTGLASFQEVGPFVPLQRDRQGNVVREVAPARFMLALPEQPGKSLAVAAALIRDLRRQVPTSGAEDEGFRHWFADLPLDERAWWEEGWQATPMPAAPSEHKLIPLVTTALESDPLELAQTYTRRWPAQENVIKDWLLPLGLDTNHGFAQTPVENSEVTKRRSALEGRLANLRRWAEGARVRWERANRRANRLWQETKARGDVLYREINHYICEYDRGDEREWRLQHKPVVKAMQAKADAELHERWQHYHQVCDRKTQEWRKQERYCRQQRELLRALEDLQARERAMYELNQAKDHVMTICKLALANLAMWVRDCYFPTEYAHATWHRLAPFFRLPGRVIWSREQVEVELYPFNDRRLNRDLATLCERLAAAPLRLPDGRRLVFSLSSACRPPLSGPPRPRTQAMLVPQAPGHQGVRECERD